MVSQPAPNRMRHQPSCFVVAVRNQSSLGILLALLLNPEEPKEKEGLTPEEIAKLEEEMEALERDVKAHEESYGDNMLNLTGAKAYIKRLLENARVVRFLHGNHPDILAEFEKIAAAETM